MYMDEASINHALFQAVGDTDVLLEDMGSLVTQILPMHDVFGAFNGTIVTFDQGHGLLEFEPAARSEMGVTLADEFVPVCYAAAEAPDVDEVKGLGGTVDPFGFGVVDVELDVRGNPSGLDGTQVGAQDLSAGVLVCKVNGPDAGTSAKIEDTVGRGLDGSIVQAAAKNEEEDVVQEVKAVLLRLVVG